MVRDFDSRYLQKSTRLRSNKPEHKARRYTECTIYLVEKGEDYFLRDYESRFLFHMRNFWLYSFSIIPPKELDLFILDRLSAVKVEELRKFILDDKLNYDESEDTCDEHINESVMKERINVYNFYKDS